MRKRRRGFLFLVFALGFGIYVVMRLAAVGGMINVHDHGIHLSIAQRMFEGKGEAYRDYTVGHMPGLNILLYLGFWLGSDERLIMLPYILISFLMPLSAYFLARILYQDQKIALASFFFSIFDPYLFFNTKVSNTDIVAASAFYPILLVILGKTLSHPLTSEESKSLPRHHPRCFLGFVKIRKRWLVFLGGFSLGLTVFLKLTAIYFFAAFLLSVLVVESLLARRFFHFGRVYSATPGVLPGLPSRDLRSIPRKVAPWLVLLTGFVCGAASVFLGMYAWRTESLRDIFFSHLFRPREVYAVRGELLFAILLLNPAYFFFFVPLFESLSFLRNQKRISKREWLKFIFLSAVFIFCLFAFFVNATFYRHHLLFIQPILCILAAVGILKVVDWPRRSKKKFWTWVIVGSVTITLLSNNLTILRAEKAESFIQKLNQLGGELVSYDNYINFKMGLEDKFGRFSSAPDVMLKVDRRTMGPCGWDKLGLRNCNESFWLKLLTETDNLLFYAWMARYFSQRTCEKIRKEFSFCYMNNKPGEKYLLLTKNKSLLENEKICGQSPRPFVIFALNKETKKARRCLGIISNEK